MFNSLFNGQSEANIHCLMYISYERCRQLSDTALSYGNRSSPDGHQKQLGFSTDFEICVKFGDLVSLSID